jgi:hypothetical protein
MNTRTNQERPYLHLATADESTVVVPPLSLPPSRSTLAAAVPEPGEGIARPPTAGSTRRARDRRPVNSGGGGISAAVWGQWGDDEVEEAPSVEVPESLDGAASVVETVGALLPGRLRRPWWRRRGQRCAGAERPWGGERCGLERAGGPAVGLRQGERIPEYEAREGCDRKMGKPMRRPLDVLQFCFVAQFGDALADPAAAGVGLSNLS